MQCCIPAASPSWTFTQKISGTGGETCDAAKRSREKLQRDGYPAVELKVRFESANCKHAPLVCLVHIIIAESTNSAVARCNALSRCGCSVIQCVQLIFVDYLIEQVCIEHEGSLYLPYLLETRQDHQYRWNRRAAFLH